MKRGAHIKRKTEFSKKILRIAAFVSISVTVFACIMIWRTGDLSPFAYIIPALAAELATGTGFYYNKAKAENQIKLRKTYGDEAEKDNVTVS